MDHRLISILAFLTLAGCAVTPTSDPSALPGGAYALDREHASVHFRVRHLGLSYVVGRFDGFDASLDFDSANPERSRMTAVVEAASINTGQARFDDVLRGAPWLAAADNPQIRFESTAIVVTGAARGIVTGDLTLRGLTRTVDMDVVFYGGAPNLLKGGRRALAFRGEMTINRRDFGLTRFGGDVVGDTIGIEIEAEFLEAR